MISGFRANNGLGPVSLDPKLMQMAETQARAMATKDKLDHDVAGRRAELDLLRLRGQWGGQQAGQGDGQGQVFHRLLRCLDGGRAARHQRSAASSRASRSLVCSAGSLRGPAAAS